MEPVELPPNLFDDPHASPPNLIGHYAGLFTRVVAFVIDALIIAIAIAIIPWLGGILLNSIGIGSFTTRWMAGVQRLLASGIFAALFTYTYYAFFWFFAGMTIGNAVMGIRIIRTNGKRVGPFRTLIRLIGYIISLIPLGLGFFWILIDDRRQGWQDKLAGTFAVYSWEARPEEKLYSRGFIKKLPARMLEHIRLPSPEIETIINAAEQSIQKLDV
jgi:uncharacterized RDD family membrane protein YckC